MMAKSKSKQQSQVSVATHSVDCVALKQFSHPRLGLITRRQLLSIPEDLLSELEFDGSVQVRTGGFKRD
jgi:hypothetical protein